MIITVVVAILIGCRLIAVVRVITRCPGGSAFSIIEQSEVFIAPAHGSLCTRCYFVAPRGVAIFTLQNNILSFNGWHSRSVTTGCVVAIVSSVIMLLTLNTIWNECDLHLRSPIKTLFSLYGTYLFCPGLAGQYSFGLYIAIL